MKYRTGFFQDLEKEPNFGLNYRDRIPVLVSTQNRIRDHVADWLRDEGFKRGFEDLTLWSNQKTPGEYQGKWVDGKIGAEHWKGKTWRDIWKAILEGFESKVRHQSDQYFILLLTPTPEWTEASEDNSEQHVLFENRNVYEIFTSERGWNPDKQIIIWQVGVIFHE